MVLLILLRRFCEAFQSLWRRNATKRIVRQVKAYYFLMFQANKSFGKMENSTKKEYCSIYILLFTRNRYHTSENSTTQALPKSPTKCRFTTSDLQHLL